jgi:cytochrome c oxidase subunit 3
MSFFKTLAEKPWQPQTAGASFENAEFDAIRVPEKTALKFFLAVVGIIFFLFTVTFLARTQYPDFQALAGEPWQPFTDASQLWLNTGALFLASIAMHWTMKLSEQENMNGVIVGLVAALLFTALFLVGQVSVWKQLYALGYFINSNPANSYFYLFTCVHGLHLLGGLIAFARVIIPFSSGRSFEKLSKGLSLCKTYWHFLFMIWILLFVLLTSSSETYNTIAVLCGF